MVLPRVFLSALLAKQAEAIGDAAAAVRARGAPEEVHALRGALRRVQASIGLVSGRLPPSDVRTLQSEICWLTRRLGPLRDLDVLQERLRRRCPYHNDARDEDVLLGLSTLARDAALEKVRGRLGSARATLLLEGLRAWANQVSPDVLAAARAADLQATVSRLDAEIRKVGRSLDDLSPKGRHALRKQIKALRYDCEALAPTCPELTAYAGLLSALHAALGDLNDDEACRKLGQRLGKGLVADDAPWLHAEGDPDARLKAAWRRYRGARPPWPGKTGRARPLERRR